MKASPKAEEVGLSFPPQSLLLLCRPLTSPGSSCRTITKASHAIQQTSGLAPNCLQAEKTPNLPALQLQPPHSFCPSATSPPAVAGAWLWTLPGLSPTNAHPLRLHPMHQRPNAARVGKKEAWSRLVRQHIGVTLGPDFLTFRGWVKGFHSCFKCLRQRCLPWRLLPCWRCRSGRRRCSCGAPPGTPPPACHLYPRLPLLR